MSEAASVLCASVMLLQQHCPTVLCIGRNEWRGQTFLDTFHQYLALPPVFEEKLDLVAFFSAFAKRRRCGEATFLQIIGAFG